MGACLTMACSCSERSRAAHERPVNLDETGGNIARTPSDACADSEVVDRMQMPCCRTAASCDWASFGLAHHRCFCVISMQTQVGAQLPLRFRRDHLLHAKRSSADRSRDAGCELRPTASGASPARNFAAGRTWRPIAEATMMPVLLRRPRLRGRSKDRFAPDGPAKQGLGRDQGTISEIDDGLEGKVEAAVGQGVL